MSSALDRLAIAAAIALALLAAACTTTSGVDVADLVGGGGGGDSDAVDGAVAPDDAVVSDATAGDTSAGPQPDTLAGVVPVYSETCNITGAPTPPPQLALQLVMSNTSISKPLFMEPAPDDSGRVFLLSQPGRVYVADGVTGDGAAQVWLDIRPQVDDGPNEAGLLGLAFDPGFASNGHVFLSYTRQGPGGLESVVSRFTVDDPATGEPDKGTEIVVLTQDQPWGNHNGGGIAFGPDGMLYIGFGDGGSANDPLGAGQDLTTWLGAMLRIDVSTLDATGSYAIPEDNPWYGASSALNEIWAYGLRNPWRFSFDSVDGALWVGDVGQNAVEEIDIVTKAGNYGWKVMEGSDCFKATVCDTEGMTLPVSEYPHAEGKSVTGGYVYRGTAMPNLYGAYLFADFEFGTIWALKPDGEGAWERTELADASAFISAFGVDAEGEVYVLDWFSGSIYRLVSAAPGAQGLPGWPPTLTDTGCFSDVPARELAPGVLPYSVNTPLWSDAAGKERALALPDQGVIEYTDSGPWTLPDGTILIKTFLDPTAADEPALETRFLINDAGDWRGATYRWNDDGTEAFLLSTAAQAELDGQTWDFPSRQQCTGCHTPAAGQVLGLRTEQMAKEFDIFGVGASSQIEALAQVGYLTGAPAAVTEGWPAVDDGLADLGARARAYLDANCAHCHQPGGLANATIDLRAHVALADTGMCDEDPGQGDLGVGGAKILSPGNSDLSTLWLRMATTDPTVRMPSIASSVVDENATDVVADWIDGLTGCD